MELRNSSSISDEARRRSAHTNGKMKRKHYEKELRKLQVELCLLQDWVKETGERIIILFEGRDAAGKGGTIQAITERVSPRVFRVVALPAPSDREKTEMFMQRYIERFPAGGRSSSLTAAGITEPASNTSWAFALTRSTSASSTYVPRSRNTSWTAGLG